MRLLSAMSVAVSRMGPLGGMRAHFLPTDAKSGRLPAPSEKSPPDNYPAFRTADRFLSDWLDLPWRVKLLIPRAAHHVTTRDTGGVAESARKYFSSSNPSLQGYEIIGVKQVNSYPFEFLAWRHGYAMGVKSFPIARPRPSIM